LRFLVPALSSVSSCPLSLHSANKDGVDGKDILGKFMFVGGFIVEENHEFCGMEGENVLEEVEGKAAEAITVGNHNLRDKTSA